MSEKRTSLGLKGNGRKKTTKEDANEKLWMVGRKN